MNEFFFVGCRFVRGLWIFLESHLIWLGNVMRVIIPCREKKNRICWKEKFTYRQAAHSVPMNLVHLNCEDWEINFSRKYARIFHHRVIESTFFFFFFLNSRLLLEH